MPKGIKNFSPAGCFAVSTVAQTVTVRPPMGHVGTDTPLTLQRPAREHVHKGGSGVQTLRTYLSPVRHPNHVACTCDVVRRRFMGRTLWKTAHRRIPTEGVRGRASPSGFRPPPLVPGLLGFRARVIVRANDYSPLPPDGPTRSIPRLPVRGKVPAFPHPEPPLLFSFGRFCPAVAAGPVRKNRMSHIL